ncbi:MULTISPECIES: hypothetical protein [unclassified Pseudomonas]|uniref:hypothetical protein n=1 Tax=unclassified Pseudomonas TaxID=196821 RepID=UPI000BDAACE4|nr:MULTISPECIES: hypothetical protein [unclassified Pseudomonas]PVZ19456.1 hypothetical protein F474_00043 [Pseudomonas sp. URIL14HWK12:I12]PVZ22959.1 hypothetical protein F470_03457 [Pseudomonas sp. URIL14HWK12:I10]PVZ37411.1 hypothetical protein F472_00043 [Pseudomonas sp. URIL14HWK12:I11]SNZ14716.1 hypothetical protein SAMN05660463_02837 [Pseudomonas sp. URIL14HWK12:I9]
MSITEISKALQVTRVPGNRKADDNDNTTGAAAEFAAFMGMTPAQRLRALILAQLGLSEDSLQKMPADRRAQIENKIAQIMKEKLGIKDEQATNNASTDVAATSSAEVPRVAASAGGESTASTGSDSQPATDQAERLLAMIRRSTALG